jgi:hypothetical protein
MKKGVFLAFLIFFSCQLHSQFLWDAGVKIGGSNYLGDIGGGAGTRRNFLPDMKLGETKLSAGAFVRYAWFENVSVMLSYNYGRIAGDDKLSSNPGRHDRNLSFRNDIHELALQGEVYFYTNEDIGHSYTFRNTFRAYAGLGVAGFYHNPEAYYQGTWYALRPLKTEGEAKPYAKYCVAIPASIGCFFTFNKHYRIGWDFCLRTTFTDYLDDVSGRYPPSNKLGSPLAVALSNRTGELNLSPAEAANYLPGNKRGDPSHTDSYLFTTFNFSYVFRGKWYKRQGVASHSRVNSHKKKILHMKF